MSLESSVLLFGGQCDDVRGSSRIVKYTDTDTWVQVGNLQTDRYGPRAILNGDKILVVGGDYNQP